MLRTQLVPFVLGAIAMASAVASMFFVRFHRETRDPLFLVLRRGLRDRGRQPDGAGLPGDTERSVAIPLYPSRLLLFAHPVGDLPQEPVMTAIGWFVLAPHECFIGRGQGRCSAMRLPCMPQSFRAVDVAPTAGVLVG